MSLIYNEMQKLKEISELLLLTNLAPMSLTFATGVLDQDWTSQKKRIKVKNEITIYYCH